MAYKHFGLSTFVMQPGTRESVDEIGIVTTERTFIGPANVAHGFEIGERVSIGWGSWASNSFIFGVETEVLEGGLIQVRVMSKDLSKAEAQYSRTVEYTRQHVSAAVPGYGYYCVYNKWIMVPASVVRCTRYSKSSYSRGSLGHGPVSAPTYSFGGPIRTRNTTGPGGLATSTVTVSAVPSAWYCVSANCTTTGKYLQEIEERWEVDYRLSYSITGDYNV